MHKHGVFTHLRMSGQHAAGNAHTHWREEEDNHKSIFTATSSLTGSIRV
jgi:hypothetical protein